ncbi:MAG: site-specific integrase [Candidatus Methanoperedens sp.]|nr:site-specific integrase [Candidatus Methanoperedens sp.]
MYYEASYQKYLDNMLADTESELLPKQKEVLVRFNREMDKNDGLALHTRISQVSKLSMLAKAVQKPFASMERKDMEDFLYSLEVSPATVDQYKIVVKKFFKWLRKTDDYPVEVKWIKLTNHIKRKLPEDILTPIEVKKLIDAADNLRDRALVSVLYESGCRVGELVGVKQKDVDIDRYGARIKVVRGKTGMRPVRLIDSAPDLTLWLNNHPNKNLENFVFVHGADNNKPLGAGGVDYVLEILGKRAKLNKGVHAHLLRHSRATHLAGEFTESELKVIFGWTRDSKMPGIYVSLSGGQVEKKMLTRAGLVDAEETRKEEDVLKARNCPRCKEVNPSTARFCPKCGMALDLETAMKIDTGESGMALELMDIMQREPRLLEMLKNITKPVAVK